MLWRQPVTEEIERLRRENELLRAELEETNQGVLALYAELDTQAEQLKQASDLKSRFLSYMSHEFRTPLGSIRSITRLLSDELDGPLSSEQHKQIAFISGAAMELSEMVDDLLDLAKIEAGRITISPAWFDMFDLFSALRGMFRPIVDGDSVDLIFEEPKNIPRLYTDDKKLAQILRNFISNALKFTQQGEVRVSARPEGEGHVRFAVTDTGIGIPESLHRNLFEDFVQIDSPLQKRLRGTGLGLSLCKRFAELLGGSVGVESTPGMGSTFFVIIPLAVSAEPVDAE
nr:histidine kinase [Pseudomonas sp.]